jgi:hypothetical protein
MTTLDFLHCYSHMKDAYQAGLARCVGEVCLPPFTKAIWLSEYLGRKARHGSSYWHMYIRLACGEFLSVPQRPLGLHHWAMCT